jgi:DNA-binding transcriptional regulator YiaG
VPFCHLTFSAARPPKHRYERAKVPVCTLGGKFRERRWQLGLEQHEAADKIGVSLAAYRSWETNRQKPDLRNVPAAIRFVGFDWRIQGASLGDQIRHARTAAGLSLRQLATQFGADPTTVREWEVGLHMPSKKWLVKVRVWLRSATADEAYSG